MAASIKYFDTAKIAYARVTTGAAATDGSGSSTAFTWYNTAPSTDYMWVRAIISASNNAGTADLADCLFNFFVTDGTTERLVRTIDAGNQAAGSTTTSAGQWEVSFGPEWIFPSTVVPKIACSVTPTAGNVDVVFIVQAA